jgi:hypothetical protein
MTSLPDRDWASRLGVNFENIRKEVRARWARQEQKATEVEALAVPG